GGRVLPCLGGSCEGGLSDLAAIRAAVEKTPTDPSGSDLAILTGVRSAGLTPGRGNLRGRPPQQDGTLKRGEPAPVTKQAPSRTPSESGPGLLIFGRLALPAHNCVTLQLVPEY